MSETHLDGGALSGARSEVLEQLRAYTVQFDEGMRHLGLWMGLPASDATAFVEVMWAETAQQPMTPARLSHRIGMTPGATTALINRLEGAGHVVRSRESSDRRIVTLRPSPGSRARAEQFFDAPSAQLEATLNGFDDDVARRCAQLLRALASTMADSNQRMRAQMK